MIVYVGNMLSKHGKSIAVIESLAPKLRTDFNIVATSDKNNKFIRLADMLITVWKNRKRCRVVLIDTYSTAAFLYAWCAARLCSFLSIPYIPVLHGGNLPVMYQNSRTRTHWFLSHAASVVSPSVYLQDFFSKHGYQVIFIPNFIDINNYIFKIREEIRPRILWVRSFQSIYNPALAIEILKSLREFIPEAELCMVGGGNTDVVESVRQKMRAYGLEEKVKVTGALPKKEWIELSENYDIFINTTSIDNMPVSVIEAMALGLLVVSSRVGGIPFLISHEQEGLLAEPGNPHEFVQSITRLIGDPAFAQNLQTNARKKAAGYDWLVVRQLWSQLLTPYST